jgi:hypothetical protein
MLRLCIAQARRESCARVMQRDRLRAFAIPAAMCGGIPAEAVEPQNGTSAILGMAARSDCLRKAQLEI